VETVDRPELDKFETAIVRDGKHKGYIIAFGFSAGAYAEAARVKREGLEVALIEVATLLEDPDVEPRAGVSQLVADLHAGIRAAAHEAKGSAPNVSITDLAASEESGVNRA